MLRLVTKMEVIGTAAALDKARKDGSKVKDVLMKPSYQGAINGREAKLLYF
jgi:hypothetical protein